MTDFACPRPRSRLSRLADRVRERTCYRRRRDWLWSLYNRLLGKRALHWLPFRGRLRTIQLVGVSGPLYARLGSTDFVVIDEVFLGSEYDALLQCGLGDVQQVLDLGANVGFSVRLWQQHFPSARVIAVEPDPRNLDICQRNVEAGPAPQRVSLVQACVAGTARKVRLDRSRGEYGYAMREIEVHGGGEIIEAFTVAQILSHCHVDGVVDLLKCDIEGAEQEVFADCHEWIGRVRHVVVELHPPYGPDQLLDDLRRNGGNFEVNDCSKKSDHHVLVLRQRA